MATWRQPLVRKEIYSLHILIIHAKKKDSCNWAVSNLYMDLLNHTEIASPISVVFTEIRCSCGSLMSNIFNILVPLCALTWESLGFTCVNQVLPNKQKHRRDKPPHVRSYTGLANCQNIISGPMGLKVKNNIKLSTYSKKKIQFLANVIVTLLPIKLAGVDILVIELSLSIRLFLNSLWRFHPISWFIQFHQNRNSNLVLRDLHIFLLRRLGFRNSPIWAIRIWFVQLIEL